MILRPSLRDLGHHVGIPVTVFPVEGPETVGALPTSNRWTEACGQLRTDEWVRRGTTDR
jgi:hypothetical protein